MRSEREGVIITHLTLHINGWVGFVTRSMLVAPPHIKTIASSFLLEYFLINYIYIVQKKKKK